MSSAILDPNDALIGRLVGTHRIIRKLGEGGMGAVYVATSEMIESSVVIKVLQPEFAAKPEIAQRFHNEAKAAARINHENVVEVREVGAFEDGRQYIVMELLRGEDLAHYIVRKGPLALPTAIAIIAQACAGVQAGHDKGILHRDLKPENVFILAEEPMRARTVKVLDFGLAKVADSGVKTRTHAIAGTPGFMAPEQAMGLGLATARSDVFALGCILFQMVTARQAWSEETIALTGASPQMPPNAKIFRPDLSDNLALVIQLAMAFDSRMRPATPRELVKRIVEAFPGAGEIVKKAAEEMVTASPQDHTWYPPSGAASGAGTSGTQLAGAVSQKGTRSWGRARLLIPMALLVVGGGITAVIVTSGHSSSAVAADGTGAPLLDASHVATSAVVDAQQVAQVVPDARSVTPSSAAVPDAGTPDAQLAVALPDAGAEPAAHVSHSGGSHHGSSTPSAAVEGTGVLKVIVTKTYATVYVDGGSVGTTPVTQSLKVGRHRVKMENPDLGLHDQFTVTIQKDTTTPIQRDW